MLDEVQKKERRWKISRAIFWTVLLAWAAAVLIFSAVILSKVQAQLEQQKDAINILKADNLQNSNIIICMLQVPIEQRTIDVKKQCRDHSLSTNQQGLPTLSFTPTSGATTPPDQTASPAAATQPTGPVTTPPPAKNPIKVLGAPLCVPFTGTCLKR